VLVEQVNDIRLESLKRRFRDLLDVLRSAIQNAWLSNLESELGGDNDLFAQGRERLAHHLLVGEGAIDLCRVEERHTQLDRRPDERDRLLVIRCGSHTEVQSHAAKPECRDFQAAVSQYSLLHLLVLVHSYSVTSAYFCLVRACSLILWIAALKPCGVLLEPASFPTFTSAICFPTTTFGAAAAKRRW
jgi:hypothetical protein